MIVKEERCDRKGPCEVGVYLTARVGGHVLEHAPRARNGPGGRPCDIGYRVSALDFFPSICFLAVSFTSRYVLTYITATMTDFT
jgi:hypothetical protein